MDVELTDKEAKKVLPFTAPTASLRIERSPGEPRQCAHYNTTIRQKGRVFKCTDCGERLDPFDYLLELAGNWERLFSKNEAASKLEQCLGQILSACGSITINADGVTAKQLTKQGAKLEAHETWGAHAWNGGVAAAITAAAERLSMEAARWGAGKLVYPRMTIEKTRGKNQWTVGILTEGGGWSRVSTETTITAAWEAARGEADRRGVPFIREERPRRLWL